MKKELPFCIKLQILSLMLFIPLLSFGQADGDYRSLKHGGGWASSGTFEVYTLSTDSWASTAVVPLATTNITIMDGVGQTSNGNGYVANNLTIGQGNAFSGTAVLTGTAVSSVVVKNPGKLMANPGVAFIGAGTTVAAGSLTFKAVGTYYRNQGSGYTNATVVFGQAWAASTVYTAGQQRTNGNYLYTAVLYSAWAANTAYVVGDKRTNGGNLYVVATAGTSAASGGPTGTTDGVADGTVVWNYVGVANTSAASGGPTGTGTGIADGTLSWNYAGTIPTAHAVVAGGKVTDVVFDTPGSGIIASGATFPSLTITGDGTGASYAVQMGVESVVISAGGNYTVAPKVVAGSSFQCGNSGTARTVTLSGDVTFKSGSEMINGGAASKNPTLVIGGNLITETPISFIGVYPAGTSYTTVSFTKAGNATISGADSCVFYNLTVGASTNVTINSTNNYIGTASVAGVLTITAGGSFTVPAGKTLTINGFKVTGPVTYTQTTGIGNAIQKSDSKIFVKNGDITVSIDQRLPKGTITVYNLVGKEIAKQSIVGSKTTIKGNFAPGVYIVKVQADGVVNSEKVIINKY